MNDITSREYTEAWNSGDLDTVEEATGTINMLDPANRGRLPDKPGPAQPQPVHTPRTEPAQPLPPIGVQTTPVTRGQAEPAEVPGLELEGLADQIQDDDAVGRYIAAHGDLAQQDEQSRHMWRAIVQDAANPTADTKFGEAFKNARKAGLKQFTWRGRPYHTKYKEEMPGYKKPKAAATTTRQPGGDLKDPFNPERLLGDQRTRPTEPRKPRRTKEGNPKKADPTPVPKPKKAETAEVNLTREEVARRRAEYAQAWDEAHGKEQQGKPQPELTLLQQAKRFLGLE